MQRPRMRCACCLLFPPERRLRAVFAKKLAVCVVIAASTQLLVNTLSVSYCRALKRAVCLTLSLLLVVVVRTRLTAQLRGRYAVERQVQEEMILAAHKRLVECFSRDIITLRRKARELPVHLIKVTTRLVDLLLPVCRRGEACCSGLVLFALSDGDGEGHCGRCGCASLCLSLSLSCSLPLAHALSACLPQSRSLSVGVSVFRVCDVSNALFHRTVRWRCGPS
jgi:hypothetical protein